VADTSAAKFDLGIAASMTLDNEIARTVAMANC
jgi:hypothetical protein